MFYQVNRPQTKFQIQPENKTDKNKIGRISKNNLGKISHKLGHSLRNK